MSAPPDPFECRTQRAIVHRLERLGEELQNAVADRLPRELEVVVERLPRLAVTFAFEGMDEAARQRFMKRFDLTMQRGGG